MADGLSQGKRSDLIGGGLIRSSGGCQQVKQNRQARLENKGDERILGNGLFVEEVLRQAEEELVRRAGYADQGIDFGVLLIQAAGSLIWSRRICCGPANSPRVSRGAAWLVTGQYESWA